MKASILTAAFALVAFPTAAAAQRTELPCQNEDTRVIAAPERATQTAAPTTETSVESGQRVSAEQSTRSEPARRRNGKRIPDAELIGPRGAL